MGTGTYVEPTLSTKVKAQVRIGRYSWKEEEHYHANTDVEEYGTSKAHDDGEERNLEK